MVPRSARREVVQVPPDPFIGREPELRGLREALRRAREGAGAVHVIAGEPGIGKTRLAELLAAEAAAAGVRVARGRCRGSGAPAYEPWAQAMRELCEAASDGELAAGWGQAAEAAAVLVPDVAERLPRKRVGKSFAESDQSFRFRLLDSLAAFLVRSSRRSPILVVLDDLQWADAGSIEILSLAGHQATRAPLLVVGTYRQTELDPRHPLLGCLGELAKEPTFREWRLEGLVEADVERYLREVRGDGLAVGLAVKVHALTAGNPLYLSQIARWRGLDREAGEQFPDGLRGAIASRLSVLSTTTRGVLAAASLAVGEIGVEPLAEVIGEPAAAVLAAMDEATRAGVLRPAAGRPGGFEFVHALIRDESVAELPLDERARVHLRFADVAERAGAGSVPAAAAEVLAHLVAAGVLASADRTACAALAAARVSLERQAWENAIRQCCQGLEVLRGRTMDGLQAELMSVHGIAASHSGLASDETWEMLGLAFEQFERSGNARCGLELSVRIGVAVVRRLGSSFRDRALRFAAPGSTDAARVLVAFAYGAGENCGDYGGAVAALDEALRIAKALTDPSLEAYVLRCRGRIEYVHFHYDEFARCAVSMAAAAAAGGDARWDCIACADAARALRFVGQGVEAGRYARRAVEIADSLQDRYTLIHAWTAAAWEAMFDGRFDVSLRYLDLCTSRAPPGSHRAWDPGHLRLLIAFETGRTEEAMRLLAPAVEGARSAKPSWMGPSYWTCLGILEAALVTGWTEELGIVRRWAEGLARQPLGSPIYLQNIWNMRAEVAWLAGDIDLARETYHEVRGHELGRDVGWLQVAFGVLARMLGHMDEAVEHLRGVCEQQRWSVWRHVRSSHVLAETLLMRDSPGDREEAHGIWSEALRDAYRFGLVPLAAQVRSGLASLEAARSGVPSRPHGLSDRETAVLRLLAAGKTNKEIGWELCISERTVENHLTRIFAKLEVTNRTAAAAFAHQTGLAEGGTAVPDLTAHRS